MVGNSKMKTNHHLEFCKLLDEMETKPLSLFDILGFCKALTTTYNQVEYIYLIVGSCKD